MGDDYCRTCDAGGHVCPGCGADTSHETPVCQQCRDEIERGER